MVAPNQANALIYNHVTETDHILKRRRLDRIKGLLEEHRNVRRVGVEDTQLACRPQLRPVKDSRSRA